MAEKLQGPGPVGGSIAGTARSPLGTDMGAERPDLEGARATAEDVGSLPVPRSVRESKGEKLPPETGSPYDLERGLQPGARRPVKLAQRQPARHDHDLALRRAEEAMLRRSLPRAARTPEELGRALARVGSTGVKDPQRGREAGPPLPGEEGYAGEK